MARGNTTRTAATLSAVATGAAPAPELEVTRTPRSGLAATHRLLVLMPAQPGAAVGWAGTAASPRAAAEPALDAWLATVLSDPRNARCTVEKMGAGGAVQDTRRFALADLGLAPLDAVYGVQDSAGAAPPAGASASELEQAVLVHARTLAGGFGADDVLRLALERPADLAAGETTFADLLEQARAARAMLSRARGADAEDLNPPERTTADGVDLDELAARAAVAEAALAAAQAALAGQVQRALAADDDALRAALQAAGRFGVLATAPVVPAGNAPATRCPRCWPRPVASPRRCRPASTPAPHCARRRARVDPLARRRQLEDRLRAVFDASFVVLPRFACAPAAATGTGLRPRGLHGHPGRRRPRRAHLAPARGTRARRHGPLRKQPARRRGAGHGSQADLAVAQLPFAAGERWIGLAPDAGQAIAPGRLSLVVQRAAGLDPAQPLAGLWIDEWTEVVPATSETTAIAFQLDPPDACAPQCILLAVPPQPDAPWTVSSLYRVLIETLDLARLRALDAESLSRRRPIPAGVVPGVQRQRRRGVHRLRAAHPADGAPTMTAPTPPRRPAASPPDGAAHLPPIRPPGPPAPPDPAAAPIPPRPPPPPPAAAAAAALSAGRAGARRPARRRSRPGSAWRRSAATRRWPRPPARACSIRCGS